MRLIVGITGATGAIFGVHLLQLLREADDVETHLVMSKWARLNIATETGYSPAEVEALADFVYEEGDQGAALSSGSFRVDAMVVIPCSMRTLAAIRHGLADNLIVRAADVTLKERRLLILAPRETPLNQIHLENMLDLAKMGVGITPPMPAFYNNPRTLDDMVHHIAVRILDQLGIGVDYAHRWKGLTAARKLHPHHQRDERDTAPRSTIMWEAVAKDMDVLRHWVDADLRTAIVDYDEHATINAYCNSEDRFVLIATGHFASTDLPAPPSDAVRGSTHMWQFVPDDLAQR